MRAEKYHVKLSAAELARLIALEMGAFQREVSMTLVDACLAGPRTPASISRGNIPDNRRAEQGGY